MVTFDDVARIALALPETEETSSYGNTSWAVKSGKTTSKGFVWERPLSKKDRKLLTEAGEIEVPPDEVILAARVEDLAEKEAVLAEHVEATFTTPHFNGYPAVLIRIPDLKKLPRKELRDVVVDAWLTRAQKRVAKAWLAEHEPGD